MRFICALLYSLACVGPTFYSVSLNLTPRHYVSSDEIQQQIILNQVDNGANRSGQINYSTLSKTSATNQLDQLKFRQASSLKTNKDIQSESDLEIILSDLRTLPIELYFSTSLFPVTRQHYLDDEQVHHLSVATKKERAKALNSFFAFKLSEDNLLSLRLKCPDFEVTETQIFCHDKLRFLVFRLSEKHSFFVVENFDQRCPDDLIRSIVVMPKINKPKTKKGLPHLFIEEAMTYFKKGNIELQEFGRESLQFDFTQVAQVCLKRPLFELKPQALGSCRHDLECLSGCCKNNLCLSKADCAKQVHESCLSHSYCVFDLSYPVFGLTRNKSNKCVLSNITNGAHLRCINKQCRPLYDYLVMTKITDQTKFARCSLEENPDYLIIQNAPGAETTQLRYIP